jgi:alkaline phosphatase D
MRSMKIVSMAVAVLLAGSSTLGPNVYAALIDGLVAYYPLDGNPNDLAQGNDATINGLFVDFQTGKVGQAVNFDRDEDNQWLSVTGTDLFGNNGLSTTDTSASAYSLQAWINPDTTRIAGGGGDGYIVASTLSTVDNHGFAVSSRVDTAGRLDAFVQKPSAAGFVFETNDNHPLPASTDGWRHVLVTWDSQLPAGPGELKVYIDNVLVGTQIDDALATSRAMATDGLIIGADQLIGPADSVPGRFFDGLIDEVAIWNRVLTADERAALYNSGAGTAVIPEPASVALLSVCCVLFAGMRKTRS